LVSRIKERKQDDGVREHGAEEDIWNQEEVSKTRQEKNCIQRTFTICISCQIPSVKCQIKEKELGGACCTYEREEQCIKNSGGQTWRRPLGGPI